MFTYFNFCSDGPGTGGQCFIGDIAWGCLCDGQCVILKEKGRVLLRGELKNGAGPRKFTQPAATGHIISIDCSTSYTSRVILKRNSCILKKIIIQCALLAHVPSHTPTHPPTHLDGGTSTEVLLYLMKQPVFRMDRMKSDDVYSTYSPAPNSLTELLVKCTSDPL